MALMTIGQVALKTGLSAKMIRRYEDYGLLDKVSRSDAGYRGYHQQHLAQLGFIRRARSLGFPLDEIKSLLALWRDPQRHSSNVKQLAEQHLADIKHKISELQTMQSSLQQLIANCHGDNSPGCAILHGLAQD